MEIQTMGKPRILIFHSILSAFKKLVANLMIKENPEARHNDISNKALSWNL